MRRGWCLPVGALALLGGSVLAAGVANGAAAATAHGSRHAVMVRPGGLARHLTGRAGWTGLRHATSANWSGYAVHGGTYKSVSASWTEPTAHCQAGGGHDYSSFWVGLDGYSSSTVEQTGTDTDCKGATPKYYAWYEMYPARSFLIQHAVKPGDKLTASVSYLGGGSFRLKLTDVTRGWTATENKTLSSATRASAEVIIEAPSSQAGELPLADFGTVHFAGATVNGSSIGSHNPTKITMVVNGQRLDKVSGLSGGTSFSGTWLHR